MNPFLEMDMTNSTMGESQGQLFIDRDVLLHGRFRVKHAQDRQAQPNVGFPEHYQQGEVRDLREWYTNGEISFG